MSPTCLFFPTTPHKGIGFHMAEQESVVRRRLCRLYGFTLVALVPLVAIYWAVPPRLEGFQEFLNSLAPFYFIVVLLFHAHHAFRVSSDLIWTGVIWFPVQSALFFGVGPLVEVFGSDITRQSLSGSVLSIEAADLFRANMLSSTGIMLVLLGFWVHLKVRGGVWREESLVGERQLPALKLALAMILVGSVLKYLIINPQVGVVSPPF